MTYSIDMDKAVKAAAQAMVDIVRKDYGLKPMALEKMPQGDQTTWRRRACVAVDAALQFVQ